MRESILKAGNVVVLSVVISLSAWPSATAQDFKFSTVHREILESRLKHWQGNDQQREETLKAMFRDAGCPTDQLSEVPLVKNEHHFPPAVICTLPGTSGKQIIVGAYLTGATESASVVLNWSAASMLPSLYQALKIQPRRHTYIFIGFTGGGYLMAGARQYAQQMTNEQVSATDAMVCLRGLGLGVTEVWPSRLDKSLSGDLATVAKALKLYLEEFNVSGVTSVNTPGIMFRITTEATVFAERKIPAITIHTLTEDFLYQVSIRPTMNHLGAINKDAYYENYKLIAAYLAYLDAR